MWYLTNDVCLASQEVQQIIKIHTQDCDKMTEKWDKMFQEMQKMKKANEIMASALVYHIEKQEVSWVWAGHNWAFFK